MSGQTHTKTRQTTQASATDLLPVIPNTPFEHNPLSDNISSSIFKTRAMAILYDQFFIIRASLDHNMTIAELCQRALWLKDIENRCDWKDNPNNTRDVEDFISDIQHNIRKISMYLEETPALTIADLIMLQRVNAVYAKERERSGETPTLEEAFRDLMANIDTSKAQSTATESPLESALGTILDNLIGGIEDCAKTLKSIRNSAT